MHQHLTTLAVLLAHHGALVTAKACGTNPTCQFASGWHEKPISGPLPALLVLALIVLIIFAVVSSGKRHRAASSGR